MNSFHWPMTYPAGDKMLDTEFHPRPSGPLAKPGTYTATLTIGDWSASEEFRLLKDPRVTTPDEHLAEQFDLLIRIRDELSDDRPHGQHRPHGPATPGRLDVTPRRRRSDERAGPSGSLGARATGRDRGRAGAEGVHERR